MIDLDTLRAIREAIVCGIDDHFDPDTRELDCDPAYATDCIMLGLVRAGTVTIPDDVCPSCIAPSFDGRECLSCAYLPPVSK